MEITLYTRPNCIYCVMAKELLAQRNVPYTEQKLDFHFTREALLEKFPTAKTYPVIVLDGFYIGGYTELNEYFNAQDGNTQQLLNEDS